jgi:glycosyltransferase involved in cell wall biosynthesis
VRARVDRVRRRFTNAAERLRCRPWPTQEATTRLPRVAVVTVNHNTAELVAHLLYSLLRVLPAEALAKVVVVDNRSDDGSVALLADLVAHRRIELVRHRGSPYHGPGLNRAMSYLRRQQLRDETTIDYVWILDSDVMVLRSDALSAPIAALRSQRGALAGQLSTIEQLPAGYAHPSANLLDPARAWRRGVLPFVEDGAPALSLQQRLRHRGEHVVDFPFYADGYLLHLGGGTLQALAEQGRVKNRYHRWALAPTAYLRHYHANPDGPRLHAAFLARFRADVAELTPAALADACCRPERLVIEASA